MLKQFLLSVAPSSSTRKRSRCFLQVNSKIKLVHRRIETSFVVVDTRDGRCSRRMLLNFCGHDSWIAVVELTRTYYNAWIIVTEIGSREILDISRRCVWTCWKLSDVSLMVYFKILYSISIFCSNRKQTFLWISTYLIVQRCVWTRWNLFDAFFNLIFQDTPRCAFNF